MSIFKDIEKLVDRKKIRSILKQVEYKLDSVTVRDTYAAEIWPATEVTGY